VVSSLRFGSTTRNPNTSHEIVGESYDSMIHTGESSILNTTQQLARIEPPNHAEGREGGERCVLWMRAAGAQQETHAATAWESRDDAAPGAAAKGHHAQAAGLPRWLRHQRFRFRGGERRVGVMWTAGPPSARLV